MENVYSNGQIVKMNTRCDEFDPKIQKLQEDSDAKPDKIAILEAKLNQNNLFIFNLQV